MSLLKQYVLLLQNMLSLVYESVFVYTNIGKYKICIILFIDK